MVVEMFPRCLPGEGFQACPVGEATPKQTQNTSDRLHFSSGLGTPRHGGGAQGEGGLG